MNKLYDRPNPLTISQQKAWRRVTTVLDHIPCCEIESSYSRGRLYISVKVGTAAVHVPEFDEISELQKRTGVYLFWVGPRGGIESNRWGFLLDDAMGMKAEEYFEACLLDITHTANELYDLLQELAQ
jgi:hypothetical protein